MADAPKTAQQYRDEQIAEWGAYVAVADIYIGTGLAFRTGDPVPASHVERGVVLNEQVAKTTTKAGREAAGIPTDSKG